MKTITSSPVSPRVYPFRNRPLSYSSARSRAKEIQDNIRNVRDVEFSVQLFCLSLLSLGLLLLLHLEQKGAVDVGEDTTEGDCGADQGIELLITTDSKLEMAGSDTLDLEVLGGVLYNGNKRVSNEPRLSKGWEPPRCCAMEVWMGYG